MSAAGGKVPFPKVFTRADVEVMERVQAKIAAAVDGVDVDIALMAMSAEMVLIEQNHKGAWKAFGQWMEAWLSRVPDALKQAVISRGRN